MTKVINLDGVFIEDKFEIDQKHQIKCGNCDKNIDLKLYPEFLTVGEISESDCGAYCDACDIVWEFPATIKMSMEINLLNCKEADDTTFG